MPFSFIKLEINVVCLSIAWFLNPWPLPSRLKVEEVVDDRPNLGDQKFILWLNVTQGGQSKEARSTLVACLSGLSGQEEHLARALPGLRARYPRVKVIIQVTGCL